MTSENSASIIISGDLISEKVLYPNGCLLLICPECPENVAARLKTNIELLGIEWFQKDKLDKGITPSTRNIYYSNLENDNRDLIVIKEKSQRIDPEWPKASTYTTSVIHEIAMSKAMQFVIDQDFPNDFTVSLNDEICNVSLRVQTPLGAIIDLATGKRFGIFMYEKGESIRDCFQWWGTWNDAPEELRKLTGKISTTLDVLAKLALNKGLEPWDLGAHQVVYRKGENNLDLTILDTEEYDFGVNERMDRDQFLGLPPLIIYLYIGISS
ncbi:MAG: hypothetical protein AAB656_03870 [Patescibacteria group bacterium]